MFQEKWVLARMELDASKASPALRTAIAALNESFDRLEAARAVFTADDLRMAGWGEMHPEPKNRRAQIEAESDFRKTQVAVAQRCAAGSSRPHGEGCNVCGL
jgi:hypothetical protein